MKIKNFSYTREEGFRIDMDIEILLLDEIVILELSMEYNKKNQEMRLMGLDTPSLNTQILPPNKIQYIRERVQHCILELEEKLGNVSTLGGDKTLVKHMRTSGMYIHTTLPTEEEKEEKEVASIDTEATSSSLTPKQIKDKKYYRNLVATYSTKKENLDPATPYVLLFRNHGQYRASSYKAIKEKFGTGIEVVFENARDFVKKAAFLKTHPKCRGLVILGKNDPTEYSMHMLRAAQKHLPLYLLSSQGKTTLWYPLREKGTQVY